MVRPKKQSKRMPARKRYKIQRKVKEHLRKSRKESKKHGHKSKKLKKDPGIPNLFPFKEQVLRQAEERKLKQEEENQRRKQQRQKLVNKKRNLASLQLDAAKRAKEFERKVALKESMGNKEHNGSKIEGSLKAYYKEFKKVVDNADVILEVLDARDPIGCRCPQVEQAVLSSGPNKKLVLVLNKIDLVPKSNVEKWLKHLRNEFPTVAFKASTQTQKQHLSQSKVSVSLATQELLSSTACVGADMILKLLGNYCRNKNIKTSVTVGIVGFPNVGKSSIINSLKRSRACTVGASPGVTKSMQEVQLDKHIKLLDSPGIVMDNNGSDASIILRNCVKIETIDDPVPAVEAILRRCNKQQVMEKYSIADYKDTNEFLAHLARRQGKLKKGGVADINAAGKTILKDWNSGKIVFYTHPPEQNTLPTHISAEIVGEWSKEFDIDALLAQEANDLKGLDSEARQEAMVLEPSRPADAATFDKYDDEEESDNDIDDSDDDEEEEDDDEEEEDVEDMEEDNDDVVLDKKQMTVVLERSKKLPSKTRNDERKTYQINDLNSQNQKRKQELKRKKKKAKRLEKDAMVDSDQDYNFDEDFQ